MCGTKRSVNDETCWNLLREASLGPPRRWTSTPVLLFAAAPPLCIASCGDIMTRCPSALSTRGIVAPYRCETQPAPRCGAFLQAFVPRHSSNKTPADPTETLLSKRNPIQLLRDRVWRFNRFLATLHSREIMQGYKKCKKKNETKKKRVFFSFFLFFINKKFRGTVVRGKSVGENYASDKPAVMLSSSHRWRSVQRIGPPLPDRVHAEGGAAEGLPQRTLFWWVPALARSNV